MTLQVQDMVEGVNSSTYQQRHSLDVLNQALVLSIRFYAYSSNVIQYIVPADGEAGKEATV